MDEAAQNYDPSAEADSGTCMYVTTLELGLDGLEASPLGVHVAGSFQGWNPGGTAMELGEDGLYRASFVAVQGDMVQYKFINGNDWGQDEGVPPECGAPNGFGGFNRELTVGSADAVVPAVCFGTCESCGARSRPVDVRTEIAVAKAPCGTPPQARAWGTAPQPPIAPRTSTATAQCPWPTSFRCWVPLATCANEVRRTAGSIAAGSEHRQEKQQV